MLLIHNTQSNPRIPLEELLDDDPFDNIQQSPAEFHLILQLQEEDDEIEKILLLYFLKDREYDSRIFAPSNLNMTIDSDL